MVIGVPKEIKRNEYRVGMVPAGVQDLVREGHKVYIQKTAGIASGISDDEYVRAGAEIKDSILEIYDAANMIVKVKEPLEAEYELFHEDQILFTYLHLAAAKELAIALLEKKVIGIAYETVQLPNGSLPLLVPMSEIAGRVSVQIGAYFLQKENGGRGVLLGGAPGAAPGKVVVVGGGTVGTNAAKVALGLGATVTLLDTDLNRLRCLDGMFAGRVGTLISNQYNIEEQVREADLIIGAVLLPGSRAPHLIRKSMLPEMKEGSVIVDVSVDQGGCVETIRPTSHDEPTYEVDGVIHYGVANIPSCVARTSTFALTNATLPYVLRIARLGFKQAVQGDESLRKGVNIYNRKVCHKAIADALEMDHTNLSL